MCFWIADIKLHICTRSLQVNRSVRKNNAFFSLWAKNDGANRKKNFNSQKKLEKWIDHQVRHWVFYPIVPKKSFLKSSLKFDTIKRMKYLSMGQGKTGDRHGKRSNRQRIRKRVYPTKRWALSNTHITWRRKETDMPIWSYFKRS